MLMPNVVFKKDGKTDKKNSRLISALPTLSKIFQCGFRKGFNAQHCLITLIKKWRWSVDGVAQTGALLIDLFKAFDCIDH